jgi:hypothetical protein
LPRRRRCERWFVAAAPSRWCAFWRTIRRCQ